MPAGHGAQAEIGPYVLLNSYHCSRLNTNTGRLTAAMLDAVLAANAEQLEQYRTSDEAKRGKMFSKHIRAIQAAVRSGGGGDPATNLALKNALSAAKSDNVPIDNVDRAIERARADLVRRPDDARAMRDLGALLAQAGQNDEATERLEQAYSAAPGDPKTLYYLGLVREAQRDRDAAVALYGRYATVSTRSPFRPLLEGRYRWLVRERLRDEMEALVAREDTLTTGEASPRTVAVFPFAYLGQDPRFEPLGRGLGEMVTVDLASLPELQVVERARLQTLLDELAFAQSEAFDPASTPRVGRLLRAGRVVGGQFDVSDETLRIDAALWDWEAEPLPELATRADALDRLFDLKREIVLALAEALGVSLTAEERDRIAEAPTRNVQAFLLYARGLQDEDAGRFGAAAEHYRQAARLDAGFRQAAERARQAEATADAGGTVEAGLAAALAVENLGAGMNLVQRRLENLNGTVGGAFFPGGDGARGGATEAATATGALGPLPDPPPPPGGN